MAWQSDLSEFYGLISVWFRTETLLMLLRMRHLSICYSRNECGLRWISWDLRVKTQQRTSSYNSYKVGTSPFVLSPTVLARAYSYNGDRLSRGEIESVEGPQNYAMKNLRILLKMRTVCCEDTWIICCHLIRSLVNLRLFWPLVLPLKKNPPDSPPQRKSPIGQKFSG